MNYHRHVLAWTAVGTFAAFGLLGAGCATDHADHVQGALPGAAAGAIITGVSERTQERPLAEIRYERRRAEEIVRRELRFLAAQSSHPDAPDSRELVAARQRAAAAESDAVRLRAEEEAVFRALRPAAEGRGEPTVAPMPARLETTSNGVAW